MLKAERFQCNYFLDFKIISYICTVNQTMIPKMLTANLNVYFGFIL